jgi:hypothetical protein
MVATNPNRPAPPAPPGFNTRDPLDNELIRKLHESLEARADAMVEQALHPVMRQAAAPIIKALRPIAGGDSAATMAAIELQVGDAINLIAREAKARAYRVLAERAIHCLATGEDFSLT